MNATVWCLLAAAIVLPGVSAQQFPFLRVPGSPKSVRFLFEDSRSRIWTSGEDLACFDGSRFFFLRDYGFPGGDTLDVAEDSSGAIWIGGEQGVYRWASGHLERTAAGVALSIIPISPEMAVAAVGPAGRGAPQNITLLRIRRSGGRWLAERVLDLESPGRVTRDASGMLLAPWPGRGFHEIRLSDISSWRPGEQIAVQHHAVARFPSNGGMKVMRDHAGCLWVGASGGNGYNCGDDWRGAPFQDANVNGNMNEAADGTMVLSGDSLLGVGRPGSFQVATRANGLPGVQNAIRARDGTVWIASNTGLYRFASPFRIEYWTIREGVMEPPWSLARVGGRIYAGLDRRIVALSRDRSRWETIAQFPLAGSVTSLAGTRNGTLLATLISGGAVELRTSGEIVARTAPDRPKCCSMRLAVTPEGETWMGGTSLGRLTRVGRLLALEDHRLQTPPYGNLLGLKYDAHTGRLWACYKGGLVERDEHGNWREITTRDGLAVNGGWSVAPLPNGDVWYAYYDFNAIARLRFDALGRPSIRQFGPDSGIEEPVNDVLDADPSGRLWRSSERGIYVAEPSQAENGQWLRLDQSDGFPANDMNSGSVFMDTDGSLWWGADNDLAHYTPAADLVAPTSPPAIFISAFSWDGGAPRLAETVDGLPHGSKIVAHMGSTQFERRNGLRIRYRVLPDVPEWRETASLDLPLGTLGSGRHTLEVAARLFVGPWSPTVSWPVTVSRPVWLTWPSMLGLAVLAASLAAAGHRFYRRYRLQQDFLLPDLAAWRMGAFLPEVHDLEGILLDGRFQVHEVLARGGFAYVLEGYDGVRKQACAIKVFRSEVKEQPWVQRRFRQEVAALERVRHPNVVRIYAHGQVPSGAPYLVMEIHPRQEPARDSGNGRHALPADRPHAAPARQRARRHPRPGHLPPRRETGEHSGARRGHGRRGIRIGRFLDCHRQGRQRDAAWFVAGRGHVRLHGSRTGDRLRPAFERYLQPGQDRHRDAYRPPGAGAAARRGARSAGARARAGRRARQGALAGIGRAAGRRA